MNGMQVDYDEFKKELLRQWSTSGKTGKCRHSRQLKEKGEKPYLGFSPFSILRPYGLGTKLIFGLVVVWPAGTLNVGLVKVVYPVFTADMILAVPLGTQME